MASPNAPKSSEQLIREHSQARYLVTNGRTFPNPECPEWILSAVAQQARKYR